MPFILTFSFFLSSFFLGHFIVQKLLLNFGTLWPLLSPRQKSLQEQKEKQTEISSDQQQNEDSPLLSIQKLTLPLSLFLGPLVMIPMMSFLSMINLQAGFPIILALNFFLILAFFRSTKRTSEESSSLTYLTRANFFFIFNALCFALLWLVRLYPMHAPPGADVLSLGSMANLIKIDNSFPYVFPLGDNQPFLMIYPPIAPAFIAFLSHIFKTTTLNACLSLWQISFFIMYLGFYLLDRIFFNKKYLFSLVNILLFLYPYTRMKLVLGSPNKDLSLGLVICLIILNILLMEKLSLPTNKDTKTFLFRCTALITFLSLCIVFLFPTMFIYQIFLCLGIFISLFRLNKTFLRQALYLMAPVLLTGLVATLYQKMLPLSSSQLKNNLLDGGTQLVFNLFWGLKYFYNGSLTFLSIVGIIIVGCYYNRRPRPYLVGMIIGSLCLCSTFRFYKFLDQFLGISLYQERIGNFDENLRTNIHFQDPFFPFLNYYEVMQLQIYFIILLSVLGGFYFLYERRMNLNFHRLIFVLGSLLITFLAPTYIPLIPISLLIWQISSARFLTSARMNNSALNSFINKCNLTLGKFTQFKFHKLLVNVQLLGFTGLFFYAFVLNYIRTNYENDPKKDYAEICSWLKNHSKKDALVMNPPTSTHGYVTWRMQIQCDQKILYTRSNNIIHNIYPKVYDSIDNKAVLDFYTSGKITESFRKNMKALGVDYFIWQHTTLSPISEGDKKFLTKVYTTKANPQTEIFKLNYEI